MSAFSAANPIQYADLISASSDGKSMVTEAPIVDDDDLLSSDEMTIIVGITTLPTDLQMLIFQIQYQSRVKVRRASGCESCRRALCVCRKRHRSKKAAERFAAANSEARRLQNNVRMQKCAAALQRSNSLIRTKIDAYIFQLVTSSGSVQVVFYFSVGKFNW